MMELGDVLTRRSIASVEIEVAPENEEVCRAYLEQQHCSMSASRPGHYLVTFPPETYAEERLGMSGLYTRHTYIVLPPKAELILITASAINETQQTRVTMGFPKEIFSQNESSVSGE